MIKNYNITRTVYKASEFLSKLKAKELDLSPNFQRRAVWAKGAKSYLIDTMIRGLPIPIIFLRERRTDLGSLEAVMEVVDGQQRIRTIVSYIAPALLKDYDSIRDDFFILSSHNEELKNLKFNDLKADIRQRILDYQISVHIFPSEVSDQEVYEIFARMNSSGYTLNKQELRNAQYFGEFKSLMYKLAAQQLQRWRMWKIFSEDELARMEEVEMVSEFAILMLKGISAKRQSIINSFYKDNDEKFTQGREITRRFEIVMDTIDNGLGSKISVSSLRQKPMFYVLFAYIYELQFGLKSELKRKDAQSVHSKIFERIFVAAEKIKKGEAPSKIVEISKRRTTDKITRDTLFNYFKQE